MLRFSKKAISTLLVILMMAIVGVAQLKPVFAESLFDRITSENEGGLKKIGKTVFGSEEPRSIAEVVARIINYIFSFLGIVFIILIIYGGFQYMTAMGVSGKIETAKNIIINATIGLAIILMSYSITYFIIQNLTKAAGNE